MTHLLSHSPPSVGLGTQLVGLQQICHLDRSVPGIRSEKLLWMLGFVLYQGSDAWKNPPSLNFAWEHGTQEKLALHSESLERKLDEAGRRYTRIREQASPRRIKRKPSLRAEPTGWQLGNVQQSMAAGANQLRTVPSQKIS